MTQSEDAKRILDDEFRFDRLVDGELSETERRELLSNLDDEPSGWRRCALAFLEAQEWKRQFGAIKQHEPAAPPRAQPPARRSRFAHRVATLMAVAASFLVALFLGSVLQRAWHGQPLGSPASSQMAEHAPALPSSTELPVVAPPVTQPSTAQLAQTEPQRADSPSSPWQMVTVRRPDAVDGSGAIQLPAVERDQLDENWLSSLPSAMPRDVLESLRRTGHEVQQHRQLVPLEMQDGRRLVVPVDQVDVHYVGNPAL